MEAYEIALRGNPDLADCHSNLALLYKELKKPRERSGIWRSIAG